ncbi:hypothetical protein ACI3KY_00315 [Microbacterium sp. ZW T2_14]|uniref:hypothetical protein n=1 Tax=Microbacterium sp. ZW T2_14 TaxID=3378079 RepID=UPI00385350F3
MSLAAKITTGVAAVAIAGLVALAAPAFASLGQAAHDTAEGVSNLTETAEPSAETVAAEPTPAPTPRDDMQAAAWTAGCDDFVDVSVWVNGEKPPPRPDRGPSEYANGTVTFNEDGGADAYTVADGDTGYSIGERFCVNYISVYKASGEGDGTLQPGQVLNIDPLRR